MVIDPNAIETPDRGNRQLLVSVVIPASNAEDYLPRCLEALRNSTVVPHECIVVDDGSADRTAAVATAAGAKVLSTGRRGGPARARNIGAEAATGDILVFIDADVCVHTDALALMVSEFKKDPETAAVMGAYDQTPSIQDFVSQYRNLLHSFVHHKASRTATTFWAGCGGIRRDVFLHFRGFDESYGKPAIEDIELGYRLSAERRKIVLNPAIQGTHMKAWTVRSVIRTDLFQRAIPWSELSLQTGHMPQDLNLRMSQRVSVAIVFLLIAIASYIALRWHAFFLVPLFANFFLLLSAYWVKVSLKHRRTLTLLISATLGAIIAGSYLLEMYAVIPLMLLACVALFVRHRYSIAEESRRRWTGYAVGGYCLCVMAFVLTYLPRHPVLFFFLLLTCTLVIINQQFYVFLAAKRGRLFAMAAIPFHWLYFLYSGIGFLIALIRTRLGLARHRGAYSAPKNTV
jgi:glycosyltransferase involved in cell wall biosynthesis